MSVNISAHVTSSVGGRSRTEIADAISRYLDTKRALGCRFNTEERSLRMFERFLAKQRLRRADQITSECVDRFLASRPRLEPRSFNQLLGCVRRLFEWMVDQEEIDISPVRTPARRETSRRLPYLFQPETLRSLIRLAGDLPDQSRCIQRGPTQATIFALLWTSPDCAHICIDGAGLNRFAVAVSSTLPPIDVSRPLGLRRVLISLLGKMLSLHLQRHHLLRKPNHDTPSPTNARRHADPQSRREHSEYLSAASRAVCASF